MGEGGGISQFFISGCQIAQSSINRFISLPQELIDELKNIASEPQQGPKRLRLLCSAILREISPTSQIVIANMEPPVEQKNIPIILPLVWVQVGFIYLG